MVVKTISSAVQKLVLLYCAGADGNTCGRKSRGDEKQLIDLEWPYSVLVYPLLSSCLTVALAWVVNVAGALIHIMIMNNE